jgi:hypothetical protein
MALHAADIVRVSSSLGYDPTAVRDLLHLARLAEGVCCARTLAGCWKTGLFDELRQGPRTLAGLREALKLPRESLRVLLDAAIHFGLARLQGERIIARSMVKRFWRGPGSLLPPVAAYCASNLGGGDALAARLRQDRRSAGGFWESLGQTTPEQLAEYGEYMAITAAGPGQTLARAWDLKQARELLDVGGSLGHFSAALTAHNPGLRATVADLAPLQPFAERWFEKNGFARVCFEPLDFRHEDFPKGPDAILFARVLHDWDTETVRRLLNKARAVLPAGGCIAIFEIMRERELGNPGPVVLNAWEVLMSSAGETRTVAQFRSLLQAARFEDIQSERPFDLTGWNTLIKAFC